MRWVAFTLITPLPGHKDEGELILTVTENGFGKRTPVADYRLQSRAGKGVINVKATQRNGKVVSILNVRENSEVVIIAQQSKIIRLEAADIRQAGRSTQGVRLLRMEEGDRIAAASLIPEDAENGNGSEPPKTLLQ